MKENICKARRVTRMSSPGEREKMKSSFVPENPFSLSDIYTCEIYIKLSIYLYLFKLRVRIEITINNAFVVEIG
jgi:hypothetical protein